MLGTIVGIVTPILGAGAWKYRKQNKKLKDTEVALSEVSVEKAKMESKADEWHLWKEQLEAEREHVRFKDERISELLRINADKETRFQQFEKDKTAQIRHYVADVMKAETELNKAFGQLIEAQKEIADLRVALEYVLEWRCEHPDCEDPRGRRPPNGKLCGQTFCMPAIVEAYREKTKSPINLIKTEQT